MDLSVFWHRPKELVDGNHLGLTYICPDLDTVCEGPGVYVFGRIYGADLVDPIYIGQAACVRRRVEQHLFGNVRLMTALRNAKSGSRVVLVGEWQSKKGQQTTKCLHLIEQALIKYALAEGHDILNDRGTKTPVHNLSMTGNRRAVRLFRSTMKIET